MENAVTRVSIGLSGSQDAMKAADMGSRRLHIGRLNWSHSGVSSFQFSKLMEYSSAGLRVARGAERFYCYW